MVGIVLDGLRDKAGVSTLRLSEQTNIPRATLQRRLKGDPDITIDEVERIAAALDVDPQDVWTLAAQAVA